MISHLCRFTKPSQKFFLVVSLVAGLLLIGSTPVRAVPPLPSSFFGRVQLNGADIDPDSTISAWINGVKYAETTVVLYEGDTVYSLDVPGDDSDTPGVIEGGGPGDTVQFRVNGFLAEQSAPWQSGVNLELPLTVSTRTLNFSAGWNLITLPLAPATSYDARTLLVEINSQGGNCTEIVQWVFGLWESYQLIFPEGQFPINLGQGYFVKCTIPGNWIMNGKTLTSSTPLTLSAGWNLIGIPYPESGNTAVTVLNGINSQGGSCTELVRWINGEWDAYIIGLPESFNIQPYEGYFVKCLSASTYTP